MNCKATGGKNTLPIVDISHLIQQYSLDVRFLVVLTHTHLMGMYTISTGQSLIGDYSIVMGSVLF